MKETNLLETQLRSLQPRHPSARLKRKIFSTRLRMPGRAWFLGPLAPVTACALLTFLAFHMENSVSISREPTATIASNQMVAAYVNGFFRGENSPRNVTFEWTNRSFSNSSIGFTPPIKSTN
jgi:hypothetical protein